MKKNLFILLFLSSVAATTWAQTYHVQGKVVSATDNSVVEMAAVQLFRYTNSGKDSVMVQGAQTDMQGAFSLKAEDGQYGLIVSSLGYVSRKVRCRVQGQDVQVKPIVLKEDVKVLGEVQVQGKAAEMTVKGDTIEYNTAAYQVGENAMVEDLLKKMNGVQVDKEGNVTVNGENITAVRIDGKKFFGNDVQSATKNIPADMIEKVQVLDEKSDLAKMTGFEDDDSEHIINLTLKKDRKKGVFGKYAGALGSDLLGDDQEKLFHYNYQGSSADQAKQFFREDFRYNASLFTNLLLGESQTTIIGGANNTNEIRMGRGRGNFGQSANSGITWTENIGVNTNIDLTKRIEQKDSESKLLLGGDGSFTHSKNNTLSQTEKTSFAGDSTYLNKDSLDKVARSWNANIRLELEYQIDTLNKLLFQPEVTYSSGSSLSSSDQRYYLQDSLINGGRQAKVDSTREVKGSLRLTYNHKFLHPGRSLTVVGRFEYGNTTGYSLTNADFLAQQVHQYTRSGNDNISYMLRASYVEPLGKPNHLLETQLQFQGRNRSSFKDQYKLDETITDLNKPEAQYDSTYSNALQNAFYSERLELNYRFINQKIDLTAGARIIASQTKTQTSYGGVVVRDTLISNWNFAPTIRFKYKFGKKEFARIIYRGNTNQPSINQMEPVRNNSNAMNETVGNLGLQPSFQHSLFAMYSRFNQDRFSSIMTGIRGSLTKDAFVNNSIYDESGKLYQQTVNAEAGAMPWNVNADFMYNTPFANKLFQFNTRTAIGFNQRTAYILRGQKHDVIEKMISDNALTLGEKSLTGNLRASEDLQIRFTHAIVDMGVRGNVTYSRTTNNMTKKEADNTIDWSVTGDVQFHLPKAWNIMADCGYTARYGYTGLTDVNEVLLNASVDKTWGNATLMLKAFDILHQKKNIVQVVGENYVSYAKYNTLPTYFLLTFSYKLNKMGKLKASGAGGYMQEMIESGAQPGQPGKMPQGPPPFMR